MIVAAAILHDIGKLRELRVPPRRGPLHQGRQPDRPRPDGPRHGPRGRPRRSTASPRKTLLLLEHAILAHHGKREFGAPILPQTIEALIVSFVDDLDAKVNIAARQLLGSDGDGEFTDKLFALDNRRIYRGIPLPHPDALDDPTDAPAEPAF